MDIEYLKPIYCEVIGELVYYLMYINSCKRFVFFCK